MPTRMIENIKKPVADLYPVVEGLRCVEVMIPDDDSYLPVLAAFIAVLGNAWAWLGTPTDRADRAYLWKVAYATTDWEQCMTCAEIIDCITNDADTITAFNEYLLNQLRNNATFLNDIAEALTPGLEAQNGRGLTHENLVYPTGGCDTAAFCGAMIALTEWMHLNNVDFLERVSSAATPASRATALSSSLPNFTAGALGTALSSAISFLSAAYLTNYNAAVTGAYLDGVVCELKCLGGSTCSITVSQLYAMFSSRVGYHPVGVDEFIQAMVFVVTGEWTGQNIADVMFFLQIGAFAFMGGFVDYRGLAPLSSAMSLGWDDPQEDCDECDPCPEAWCRHMNAANGLDTLFTPFDGGGGAQSVWTGTGWALGVYENRISIKFDPGFAQNVVNIRVVNSEDIIGGVDNNKTIYRLSSGNVVTETLAVLSGVADSDEDVNTALQNWLIDEATTISATDGTPVPGEITDVYITGYGTSPDWGEAC